MINIVSNYQEKLLGRMAGSVDSAATVANVDDVTIYAIITIISHYQEKILGRMADNVDSVDNADSVTIYVIITIISHYQEKLLGRITKLPKSSRKSEVNK